jgi:putative NADPH-quinone reductase
MKFWPRTCRTSYFISLAIIRNSLNHAHPNRDSFNHAIAQAALATLWENGHQVVLHNLYAEQFDPLLPADEIAREAALPPEVTAHCREIETADGLIIVHPNWWSQPPF